MSLVPKRPNHHLKAICRRTDLRKKDVEFFDELVSTSGLTAAQVIRGLVAQAAESSRRVGVRGVAARIKRLK